ADMNDVRPGLEVELIIQVGPQARLAVVEPADWVNRDQDVMVEVVRPGIVGGPIFRQAHRTEDAPRSRPHEMLPRHRCEGRYHTPSERLALDHVWIHSARWLDLAERDGLRVMVRGEGCRLYDAQGRSYIDGLSGLHVVNVGHGRAEIGEAMAQQAGELAYVSSASYTNLAAVQLGD